MASRSDFRGILFLIVIFASIDFARGEGELRLTGGNSLNEGRLEVYLSGEWGTVCSEGWSYKDAAVACRQLGYIGARVTFYSTFVPPSYDDFNVLLDNVRCTGHESRLADCDHSRDVGSFCSHGQDVGVICSSDWVDPYFHPPAQFTVRLVDGPDKGEGFVQIYYGYGWREVCSGSAQLALPICRQLGFEFVNSIEDAPRSTTDVGVRISCYLAIGYFDSNLSGCQIYNASSCDSGDRPYISCTNIDVVKVRLVAVPLFCGLLSLCALCLPCCVACHLYRKKGGRADVSASQRQAPTATPGVRVPAIEVEMYSPVAPSAPYREEDNEEPILPGLQEDSVPLLA